MKRFFLATLIFILYPIMIAGTISFPYISDMGVEENIIMTEDDGWILIGEVTLSNHYQSSEAIKANLYVKEIGKNLIYRVEYHGNYYATRWHDNSKSYHVTINDKTYRCDAPTLSKEEENDDGKSAKFVGKWGFSSDGVWFVDISYKNGEYDFFLNPYFPYSDGEIIERHVTATEFIYTKKSETDYRPEMRSKGWSYMYDDCDKNADIGYPKTGQYKYDKDVLYSTISISLTGSVPTYSVKKFHTDYYYQGSLTYAETESYKGDGTKLVQIK